VRVLRGALLAPLTEAWESPGGTHLSHLAAHELPDLW